MTWLIPAVLTAVSPIAAAAADLCFVPSAAHWLTFADCLGRAHAIAWQGYSTECTSTLCGTDLWCIDYLCPALVLSGSDTDWTVACGSTPSVLYVWAPGSIDARDALGAEFALAGSLPVADFVPRNGWTNFGTATNVVMNGPCVSLPAVIGEVWIGEPVAVEGDSWGRVKSIYHD